MEKIQAQLPYHASTFHAPSVPTLFLGILEVPPTPKKRAASKPGKMTPPRPPLPGRRVTFLDISPKPKV